MNQLIPAKKDGENSDTLRIKTTLTGGLAERQIYSPFFYPAAVRAAASRNTSTAESLIVIHKLKK
jgi:hypothetical protein